MGLQYVAFQGDNIQYGRNSLYCTVLCPCCQAATLFFPPIDAGPDRHIEASKKGVRLILCFEATDHYRLDSSVSSSSLFQSKEFVLVVPAQAL